MARKHGRTAFDNLLTGILRDERNRELGPCDLCVEECVTRQHKLFMLEESTLWQSVQQHTSGNPRLSECKHILRIRWMIVSTRLAMEVPWTKPRIRREERDLCSERLATKATCDVQKKR